MNLRLPGTMWCLSSAAVLLLLAGVATGIPTAINSGSRPANGDVQFHIVHTNDMHARFEQTSKTSGACSNSDATKNKCYGGFARVATTIRNARAGSTPVLFLNAGDTYQGTVWFTVYHWKVVAKFLGILKPDAASLGNHEFDDGVAGLVPFLDNVTFPVLAANLDLVNEPKLKATKLAKSTVLNVNGRKIGIIGYLTPETKLISSTENVIFEDEVEAVAKEAKRLKENGVNILIALGHSGYTTDKIIAEKVKDIDLVIGGHTNTFLYSGAQPDSETPEGLYPTAITQSNGRIVYVVQAYAYTKYVGNISVTFDSEGELKHIEGSPILLDSSIEQAPDVLKELENWKEGINNVTNTVIGSSRVHLTGAGKICRYTECNLGNLVTDALISYNSELYTGSNGWTDVAIAVMNSGSVKTSIPMKDDHKITMGDVLDALPFGSSAVVVPMTGKELRTMIEWGVYNLPSHVTQEMVEDLKGSFLQFSGIQVTYDLTKPPNSKVVSVQVRCANCTVPVFSDLNEEETYPVIINDYMYAGGDGFTMLAGLKYKALDATLADILIEYLKKHSPVYPAEERRIIFKTGSDSIDSAAYVTRSTLTVILPVLMMMGILI